jgi:two-component system NarL family sensor kinase
MTAGQCLGHPHLMDLAARGGDEAVGARVDPGVVSTLVLLATLGLLGGSLVFAGAPPGQAAVSVWMGVTAALGAVIVRRARSRIGWLIQIGMVVVAFGEFARAFAEDAVSDGAGGFLVTSAASIAHWLLIPAAGLFVYVFLLFPTGRLPGPRWRAAAWVAAIGIAAITVAVALKPGPLDAIPELSNPLGIASAADALELIETAGSALLAAAVVAALASLFVRWRRSRGDERQQVKWLLFAAGLLFATGFFAMITEGALNELSFVGLLVGLFAVPAALTVALTKYRLYDIDLVVNRTLVYAILTAAVVVLYILIVGMMGSLFQRRVGLVPALIATGVVAVAFQPLRRFSQDAVDRAMFGQRRDPYGALANLAGRLESTFDPEEVLPAIVETVARSLKLAYVAIEAEKEGASEIAASWGSAIPGAESTALVYQGEEVGRLVVAPRRGDTLTPTDRRLLADLARNAGAAVHAVALTDALRRSRNELLAAREEERRRLRRDLHDGLGPELAGIALGLGAAVNLSSDERPETKELLTRIKSQADAATRGIRSLVDGLRPSALDDLGLVGAVREKGAAIASRAGMAFEVHAPAEVPDIPAAVEVAAMRIALEAITNAVRHSSGTRCYVTFGFEHELVAEIADDGVGIAEGARGGVGLLSMRERAEEVGGSVVHERGAEGGTVVRVALPLR